MWISLPEDSSSTSFRLAMESLSLYGESAVVVTSFWGTSLRTLLTAYSAVGISPFRYPILAPYLTEIDLLEVGGESVAGHVSSQYYFEGLLSEVESAVHFRDRLHQYIGDDFPITATMESAYGSFLLWGQSVRMEKSVSNLDFVHSSIDLPSGLLTIDESNNAVRLPRILQVNPEGHFEEVWRLDEPIAPQTYFLTPEVHCDTRTLGLIEIHPVKRLAVVLPLSGPEGEMGKLQRNETDLYIFSAINKSTISCFPFLTYILSQVVVSCALFPHIWRIRTQEAK